MTNNGYEYDPARIGDAHRYCQTAVENAMKEGYTRIAVANTFTQRWEMAPYYKLAEEYFYTVTEITLSGVSHGNIHNVPEDKIQAMRDRWEK